MTDFVLASRSPRRRELLGALGLRFSVDSADVDETPLPDESPEALVCRLCRSKAAAVVGRHPGEVILAADTLVVLNGALLGKPADPLEAISMLVALRDRTHVVYTAVCVMRDGVAETRVSITDVQMRSYTDAEIESYVETGDPLDKAGAYGIQDPHFAPVQAWNGCYSAVMGLPLGLAADLLANAGLAVRTDVAVVCESITGDRCCLRNGVLARGRSVACSHGTSGI